MVDLKHLQGSYVILSLVKPCHTSTLVILKAAGVCDGMSDIVRVLFRVIFRLTYCILLIIVAFNRGWLMGKITVNFVVSIKLVKFHNKWCLFLNS